MYGVNEVALGRLRPLGPNRLLRGSLGLRPPSTTTLHISLFRLIRHGYRGTVEWDRIAEQTFQNASIALNLLLMSLLRSPSEGVQGSSPVGPDGGELIGCGRDHPTKFSWVTARPSVILCGYYGRGSCLSNWLGCRGSRENSCDAIYSRIWHITSDVRRLS